MLSISSFNLLATTYRGAEHEAASELFALLIEMGDSNPKIEVSGVLGLLVVDTKILADNVIEEVRRRLRDDPWRIRYILRLIPIASVIDADLKRIGEWAEKVRDQIDEDETFRVTVEKRHSSLHTKDVVETVASRVDRKVDLENPDKVILIEILGRRAGVAILKPSQILSVVSEKRSY